MQRTIVLEEAEESRRTVWQRLPGLQTLSGSLIKILITLLVIGFLTLFGLMMAERGRARLPAEPLNVAGEALKGLGAYLFQHPQSYYWHREEHPAFSLVASTLLNSVGLILVSLVIAVLAGVPFGVLLALSRRKLSSTLVLTLSILGISTPSFLFGMLLWVVNIRVHNWFDIPVLPSVGFGWDAHMVMPVLVLAMRPLAQITQVTYVTLSEVLSKDYVWTAYAKGLPWILIRNRHALPNVLIPIISTIGTSLRFSLASLPVVEYFFDWPGVGSTLLEAIEAGNIPLITDLILSLGVFFLFVNLFLEQLFPFLDPRLRRGGEAEEQLEHSTLKEWVLHALRWWQGLWQGLFGWLSGKAHPQSKLPPLPAVKDLQSEVEHEHGRKMLSALWVARVIFTNPALIIGSLLVFALFGLVFYGSSLTPANPYEVHGVMMVEGEISAPPHPPSALFPWGTDHIGRDIQSLVFNGARQTLTLAFFGMLVRILIGITLGAIAGWRQKSWIDRLVMGTVDVWAAFPVTLFAMILIQALGIQQGLAVFVIGISVVGWGEAAQFVRGQVIGIKPKLYIEAARSVGSRSDQILMRHVFPNLLAPILVLAVLEMGGVLMLLAELGFLNVFLGGGFRVMIGESGRMVPVIAHISDVPEWGALLANIRNWWRSYPWMAWYPGVAFFLTILAFNLMGEGLRRFLESSRVNVNRVFSRFTLIASVLVIAAMGFVLQSNAPLSAYRNEARRFDAQRANQTIVDLASPRFQGRETGTPGAYDAALYLAGEMEKIGLLPGGEGNTFIQTQVKPRIHLIETPTLTILDAQGQPLSQLVYRQDFSEVGGLTDFGDAQGMVVGLALGEDPGLSISDPYSLGRTPLYDRLLLVREEDFGKRLPATMGLLIVTEDPLLLHRKYLYGGLMGLGADNNPLMYITPRTAEQILAPSGTSLDDFMSRAQALKPGEVFITEPGASVHMAIHAQNAYDLDEKYYNVVGIIPGFDPLGGRDSQVIIVSAYYDGLGVGPDGTFYPGANDNASGVAAMLELARNLMETDYKPDKTMMFIAWCGGERSESLSVTDTMNGHLGFNNLTVDEVIELSGVGAGRGDAIALGEGSSYRLVQLFQKAAGRFGVPTTTRGREPHYGLPVIPPFAGRSALSLYVSWDGSDELAHLPVDGPAVIDLEKLEQTGRVTLLTLFVLSREPSY